ncbi:uridine kinase [Pedococcus cremeus]|uniref:uridine kinase n=1 Tax=Pedococcus cremeus TaxID=587636 RepID=UPI001FE13EBF|nr:uridine kinase [Pedococcus cremeus]
MTARQETSAREVTPARAAVLAQVAGLVPDATDGACTRLGVDGVDGSGKTVFAAELADALRTAGRDVVQVSLDDFHHVREVRYRRGRSSPEGFWLDSFDYPRFAAEVLRPLGPGGSGRYRPRGHDLATDEVLDEPFATAPPGAVLVVDGLFLHRQELEGLWDFTVFLDVPFDVTAKRMAARDGTHPDPKHPTMARYVHAQRRYFTERAPWTRADVVVDNADVERPAVTTPTLGACP